MAFKLIVLLALTAVARAGYVRAPISYVAPAAPLVYPAQLAGATLAYATAPVAKVAAPAITVTKSLDPNYALNPQYNYAYDVQDALTGDNKEQEERRNGDNVQGRYSFIEADGSRRIVEYTADPINGFNAVVRKEPVQPVDDYDPNPDYSYSYDVHDTLTRDAKSQQEKRKGDVVEGSYSLLEADGSRRDVHYTADNQNGFNAVVEKQPAEVALKAVAPVHVKTIAPAVTYAQAAPLAYKVGAIAYPATIYARSIPVAYSAPLYHR